MLFDALYGGGYQTDGQTHQLPAPGYDENSLTQLGDRILKEKLI